MGTATGTDLACFGYLAYAQVFGVAAYPAANSGAQVTQIIPSLAGDAAIAALTARQHTHGAGAAFSGGLAHAHLRGAGLAEALQAACAVATAHCAAANHIPRQRLHADLIKEHPS